MKINNSVIGIIAYTSICFVFYFLCLKLGLVALSSEAATLDGVVISCASFSIYSTVLFILGHLFFRKMQITSRTLYSLCGALAFIIVTWSLVPQSSIQALRDSGLVTLGLLPPFFVGVMAGFLYHNFAGFALPDYDADEVSEVFVREDGTKSTDSIISTSSAEFYDGPMQVKTSFGALLIASVVGLILNDIVQIFSIMLSELVILAENTNLPNKSSNTLDNFANNFNFALIDGLFNKILFFIPYGFTICVIHLTARSLSFVSYGAYLATALVVPIIFAILVSLIPGMAAIVIGVFGLPLAIGILLYRKLAGVEPKSLPEEVIVSDKRTLVGKTHALRKYRRVVSNT